MKNSRYPLRLLCSLGAFAVDLEFFTPSADEADQLVGAVAEGLVAAAAAAAQPALRTAIGELAEGIVDAKRPVAQGRAVGEQRDLEGPGRTHLGHFRLGAGARVLEG